ncbi:MAG: NAD(P)-dependent oxidoreductase [Chloroflexi bacterium]|nr:NAD(P)-dependent oxidoreductase [Chloroflexota bacterium]
MNILVIGGTGFIGAEIVRHLVKSGHELVVFHSTGSESRIADIKDKINLVRGTLSNFSHLINAVRDYHIDVIYHLGGMLSISCEADPWSAFEVNLRGTLNVLEAARLFDVRQVIFASSRGTYGIDIQEDIIGEYSLQRPDNFYGITKLSSELFGRYYRKRFGLDFRGVRLGGTIGPGVKSPGMAQWAAWAIENAFRGKPFSIWVSPDARYSFLYYKDVISGILKLSEAPRENIKTVVYNLGNMQPGFSAQELVDEIKKRFPDAGIDFQPDASGARKDRLIIPADTDIHWARDEWGWQPGWNSLPEIVEDYLQELKSHPDRYV